MVADRRTSGTYVEDEGIEWKVGARIRERLGDMVHVNVTSYNRNVLLTGEAPSENMRDQLNEIVANVENVRGMVNEVAVGPGPPSPRAPTTRSSPPTSRRASWMRSASRRTASRS